MAKKSRKRRRPAPPKPASAGSEAEARAAPKPRRRLPDERPPAPWGSFPLVEVAVVVALVLMVGGFVAGGERGRNAVFAGLAIGSLAGLELSVREHFAGFRSHTLVLSGVVGLAAMFALAFALPSLKLLYAFVIAGIVAGAVAWALTRAFRRRSGLSFKVR